jgi:hypothetical protein
VKKIAIAVLMLLSVAFAQTTFSTRDGVTAQAVIVRGGVQTECPALYTLSYSKDQTTIAHSVGGKLSIYKMSTTEDAYDWVLDDIETRNLLVIRLEHEDKRVIAVFDPKVLDDFGDP